MARAPPNQHHPRMGHQPNHKRAQPPDDSFLANLRQCIEGHFNLDQIMHNDVLQAVLNCYQGYYPMQFLVANPNFHMYIAHCVEENIPILPTFLRSLEYSRMICVTEDHLFAYLVNDPSMPPSPPQEQVPPTPQVMHVTGHQSFSQAASAQPPQAGCSSGVATIASANNAASVASENVPELATINDKPPQMIHAHTQFMNNQHQIPYASESPTSVFDYYPDQGQPMNDHYHYYEDAQPRFFQQGPPALMFYASPTLSTPRPTFVYTTPPSQFIVSPPSPAAIPPVSAPAENLIVSSTTTHFACTPHPKYGTRPHGNVIVLNNTPGTVQSDHRKKQTKRRKKKKNPRPEEIAGKALQASDAMPETTTVEKQTAQVSMTQKEPNLP